MNWFSKLIPAKIRISAARKKGVPEGLWSQCSQCSAMLYRTELDRNLDVCPKCDHHIRIGARKRLQQFLDPGDLHEIGEKLEPIDRLKFKDSKKYKDRLTSAMKTTGEKDALVGMHGKLKGMRVVAAAFEFRFLGGSMGAVVGERFVRAARHALHERIPLICFSASGGARMQEALLALMQMAKTSAALASLAEQGIPYISVMTDPTTGGVAASLAMLGDINIAEPKALIAFTGPRVIEQTLHETLPEGFQRSEFLVEHGMLDMIVHRHQMRDTIAHLLNCMTFQAAHPKTGIGLSN